MPRGRARSAPHAKTKAAARVLSPDERWAAAIRERILADCHPWQRMVVEDPSRRISLLVGRGGAKTTSMRARAALKLTSIRRADVLYLAITDDHARELNWDPLQEMNEHYGLELSFHRSDMVATCKRTGSRYVMGGMDTDTEIEKYRGKSRNELQVDEAASHPNDRLVKLVERVVGPRLGDRRGSILIGGTPGHDLAGMFYDATRPGSPEHAAYADRDKPGYAPAYWSSHAWSLAQVAALPRAAELYPALVALWEEALLEKAKKGWSDENPIWMREYLGLWSADHTGRVFKYEALRDGVPWNQWDPCGELQLEGIQQLEASIAKLKAMGLVDLHFVHAADMGSSDPFAFNVLAFSPADPRREIFHVMGFERTRMYARPIAELIAGPEAIARVIRNEPIDPLGGVLGVTGWPDAAVMDSDGATLDELSRVYAIRMKKAEREARAKRGMIELVNGDLYDGRIKVIKGSALEQQLQQLKWREDQFGQVKEDPRQANHSTDTLVYGRKEVAILFESGVVGDGGPAGSPSAAGAPSAPAADVRRPDDYDSGIGSDDYSGLLTSHEYVDAWGNR